ncbi:ATP-binding cassette domain-containing protein [Hymenobacter sp. BT186]|uniref:ATP-binding cassette domain-containing protein n=1 Tax=Hymenobacter telluris TaxID=2816474 RepID=A0A939EUU2_9BACT|nr:polysaccharide ABC transporter ATP-binding protein [Hymenobacter telluris]MBO0357381.1 ATP-binding cassette domain-containing protein [Hymenobacter telluris]MBW3373407.1 ATP-binding cassette domain-containing protein [Hymenobacter norwichensis]
MSNIAIRVEDLGKQYRLGEIGTGTLSHDLNRWWSKMRGKEDPFAKVGEANDRTKKGNSDYVWALRDVNFDVKAGEVLGIIGRNGAGKSTLLKILSKVTAPTTGRIKIQGRIASLLEVGTGFHPDLTGRENVYLNGAILGMSKSEISRKFDEIVDFSGVERYIDTPVKRYSSGMYVRLAFAVSAFLEPEILIVDEVLAVGDAEFQKKCLGRMEDVSKNDGRTILFVSHNMAAVSNLCTSTIFMRNGTLQSMGPTDKIIEEYISYGKFNTGQVLAEDIQFTRRCTKASFEEISIISNGEITSSVDIKNEVIVEMNYRVLVDGAMVYPSIHVLDNMATCILATFPAKSATIGVDEFYGKPLRKGLYKSRVVIPGSFLNEKTYSISAFLVPEDAADMEIAEEVLSFSVTDTGEMRKEYGGDWWGLIRPKMAWSTERVS